MKGSRKKAYCQNCRFYENSEGEEICNYDSEIKRGNYLRPDYEVIAIRPEARNRNNDCRYYLEEELPLVRRIIKDWMEAASPFMSGGLKRVRRSYSYIHRQGHI